jgi:hypothetical protein
MEEALVDASFLALREGMKPRSVRLPERHLNQLRQDMGDKLAEREGGFVLRLPSGECLVRADNSLDRVNYAVLDCPASPMDWCVLLSEVP